MRAGEQGPLNEKPDPYRSYLCRVAEKESESMDINEPSLMDVAHDTINSTQGPALIEVADSPSSEGSTFFVVIVGGSHEIYAGRRNQMKVEGPFDSLRGIDDGLFVWSITNGTSVRPTNTKSVKLTSKTIITA